MRGVEGLVLIFVDLCALRRISLESAPVQVVPRPLNFPNPGTSGPFCPYNQVYGLRVGAHGPLLQADLDLHPSRVYYAGKGECPRRICRIK